LANITPSLPFIFDDFLETLRIHNKIIAQQEE